jgi:hypothetical protein
LSSFKTMFILLICVVFYLDSDLLLKVSEIQAQQLQKRGWVSLAQLIDSKGTGDVKENLSAALAKAQSLIDRKPNNPPFIIGGDSCSPGYRRTEDGSKEWLTWSPDCGYHVGVEVEQAYASMNAVARQCLATCETLLLRGLDFGDDGRKSSWWADDLVGTSTNDESIMQMFVYRSQGKTPRECCAEHVDRGILTLIYSEDAGLRVRDKANGTLHTPDPGSLLLLSGATLQRATAGLYPASRHSVAFAAPAVNNGNTDNRHGYGPPEQQRVSLVFKLRASLDSWISCAALAAAGIDRVSVPPFCFPVPTRTFINSFQTNFPTVNPTTAPAAKTEENVDPIEPASPQHVSYPLDATMDMGMAMDGRAWDSDPSLTDRAMERAEALRERGNAEVSAGRFRAALRWYRASIQACPHALRKLRGCLPPSQAHLTNRLQLTGQSQSQRRTYSPGCSSLAYFATGWTVGWWDPACERHYHRYLQPGTAFNPVRLRCDAVTWCRVCRRVAAEKDRVLVPTFLRARVHHQRQRQHQNQHHHQHAHRLHGQQAVFLAHAIKVQANRSLCHLRLGQFDCAADHAKDALFTRITG